MAERPPPPLTPWPAEPPRAARGEEKCGEGRRRVPWLGGLRASGAAAQSREHAAAPEAGMLVWCAAHAPLLWVSECRNWKGQVCV